VDGVGADGFLQVHRLGHGASRQDFVQHVPADQRHEPDGDFEGAVLPTVTWQGDVQIDLKREDGDLRSIQKEARAHEPIFRMSQD